MNFQAMINELAKIQQDRRAQSVDIVVNGNTTTYTQKFIDSWHSSEIGPTHTAFTA